nr:hypothetical protein [Klebsiella pneumoniae subsp. pneumoniae]
MFPRPFLRQELRDAPGRASYTLRLTLSCAVLITLFMTLQILSGRCADRRILRQPA